VTAGHAPYEELSKGEQMAKKSAKKSVKKAAKKTAAKKATKTAKKTAPRKSAAKPKAKKTARKPNAAFMKPLTPSPELAEVVGAKPLPRTEATSALWRYIKKNNLQDPKNKRMIKADPALKAVFGGKSTVNMFEMTKLVSKHLR
jgi:chromatin remodeling complex protein RSC6